MKLQILLFFLLFSCITISLHAEEGDIPVNTTELPSTTYLKREKRSISNDRTSSALASSVQSFGSQSTSWQDPFLPGEGEWSNPGNVGAPAGDISLPMILSILFLYFLYRGVSTSKRRNNDF